MTLSKYALKYTVLQETTANKYLPTDWIMKCAHAWETTYQDKVTKGQKISADTQPAKTRSQAPDASQQRKALDQTETSKEELTAKPSKLCQKLGGKEHSLTHSTRATLF